MYRPARSPPSPGAAGCTPLPPPPGRSRSRRLQPLGERMDAHAVQHADRVRAGVPHPESSSRTMHAVGNARRLLHLDLVTPERERALRDHPGEPFEHVHVVPLELAGAATRRHRALAGHHRDHPVEVPNRDALHAGTALDPRGSSCPLRRSRPSATPGPRPVARPPARRCRRGRPDTASDRSSVGRGRARRSGAPPHPGPEPAAGDPRSRGRRAAARLRRVAGRGAAPPASAVLLRASS